MDVERIRIVGCELAQSRDPRANLPNATEWATAVRIIERLDRHDANTTRPADGTAPALVDIAVNQSLGRPQEPGA